MHFQILVIKEKIAEKSRLESILLKLKADLQKALNTQKTLEYQFNKESKDLKKLEGNGIISLFYSFLGNKVEKLDKKRQQYVSIRLKLDNCKNEIASSIVEIEKLIETISAIGDPYQEYLSIIEKQRNLLHAANDSKLAEMENNLTSYSVQKIEFKEAIFAGESSLNALNKAINSLKMRKTGEHLIC